MTPRYAKWALAASAVFVFGVLIGSSVAWARAVLGIMLAIDCWAFGVMHERYP